MFFTHNDPNVYSVIYLLGPKQKEKGKKHFNVVGSHCTEMMVVSVAGEGGLSDTPRSTWYPGFTLVEEVEQSGQASPVRRIPQVSVHG